jgi:hypothetical protein
VSATPIVLQVASAVRATTLIDSREYRRAERLMLSRLLLIVCCHLGRVVKNCHPRLWALLHPHPPTLEARDMHNIEGKLAKWTDLYERLTAARASLKENSERPGPVPPRCLRKRVDELQLECSHALDELNAEYQKAKGHQPLLTRVPRRMESAESMPTP